MIEEVIVKRKNKLNRKYITIGLLALIMIISIGYAILQTNLNINGTITAKSNTWDIHFENLQVSEGSVDASLPVIDTETKTSVTFSASLENPGDYYEFTVDVVNKGTIDAMVNTITTTSLTPEQKKYIDLEVAYDNGMEIKPHDFLVATKGKKTIVVYVEYKEDINKEDLPTANETIDFSVSIDYVQADENIYNYAKLQAANCDWFESEYSGWELSCENDDFRNSTYLENIKTLTFENNINIPEDAVESWDIGEHQNGDVMAYVIAREPEPEEDDEEEEIDPEPDPDPEEEDDTRPIPRSAPAGDNNNTYYDLFIQSNKPLIANEDMSYWFVNLTALDELNNLNLLDTSNVINMMSMFEDTGLNSEVFTLDLGNNFDTSNVIIMSWMFSNTGESSENFTLDLGDKFDTSNVIDMSGMFSDTGENSNVFTLNLGNNFDTSNVIDMSAMFQYTGHSSEVFTLYLGNKFDTSEVTDMGYMFSGIGSNSEVFTLNLGNNFDTSNVIDMRAMFQYTGRSSKVFSLDLGDKFDTSNVTDMDFMFSGIGSNCEVFTLNLGNKFDTSKVTKMEYMFALAGGRNKEFTLDLGNKFKTSNVTNMRNMFRYTGYSNPNFILDLSTFDTTKVEDMENMFEGSSAKVGYARTQADADRFNASSNKPSYLTFIVKPYTKTSSDGNWEASYGECVNGSRTMTTCTYVSKNTICNGGGYSFDPTYMCTLSTSNKVGHLEDYCDTTLINDVNVYGGGLPSSIAC